MSEAPRAAPPQACFATRDAAKAAGAVLFATKGNYPKTFFAMTKGSSPVLVANDDMTVTAHTITGKGWTLKMRGDGKTSPRSPARAHRSHRNLESSRGGGTTRSRRPSP